MPIVPGKHQCQECSKEHVERADCDKCGACLYAHGRQIPDDMYPFVACRKCGQVHFWD